MLEFAHGWLVFGTLGGSIPIIIHLLNRRRFRIIRWAAMEFLLASLKKNYKRIRFENLLLLVLRALMIMLMALALARPILTESGILGALAAESRHVIILIDTSLSMGYRDGASTCFERAKNAALVVLDSLQKGDVVSLVEVSDDARPIIKEATLDVELVRNEIRRAEPGWGGTDIRKGIIAAAELLGITRKSRKDIFLFTDMQALGWGKKGDEPSAELRAAVDRIRKEAKLFLAPVGADEPENIAVTRLLPRFKVLGTGLPTEFEVEVANFSRSPKSGVQVAFLTDRFSQDTKTVDIPAGGTAAVSFTHTFRAKGTHLVQAQVGEDRLKADNIRHLAATVEESIPVLLVNGEVGAIPADNETFYLEMALKPPTPAGAPRPSHIEPTTITEFGLSAADFEKYRLVVLANLASMPAANTVQRLEDYVRNGGALVIFLGDRIDTAFYNERLHRNGAGLLPAQLGAEIGSTGPDKKGFGLELAKPVYPAFQFFADDNMLLLSRVAMFYKGIELAAPKRAEDSQVVARFDGGSPAIVARDFGRGKVVLFASSADAEWNNLGPTGTLLIMMHELASYLASGDLWQRNVLVNQPYRRVFAPEELIEMVRIRPPNEGATVRELRPYASSAGTPEPTDRPPVLSEISFAETRVAGPYELELVVKGEAKRPMEHIAVNTLPDESDLRQVSVEEAKQALAGLPLELVSGTSNLRLAVRQSRAGREFARSLLIAVLLMACVELILAQRFGR